MRPKYPAETTNFYRHPKWQCDRSILNAKTNSFFVRKFENEKGIRYPFFVRKFEKEKGKNGIYTDPPAFSVSSKKHKEMWGEQNCLSLETMVGGIEPPSPRLTVRRSTVRRPLPTF